MPSVPRKAIIASHLILTGYAHWLSNDLRGSGSTDIRKEELKQLGEILPGRQYPQPARDELRAFHREAEPLLEHKRVWFDEQMRNMIANAIAEAAGKFKYTLWAYAGCSNHSHAVVRTHRDTSEMIWGNLADAAKAALRKSGLVPDNHPVWSNRPYKVFLFQSIEVVREIDYVNDNPGKEGLPRQDWWFIKPCPYCRN